MSNGITQPSPNLIANLVTTTPSRFSVIQPALLPTMQVLETINTDLLISTRMQQLIQFWNNHDPPNAAQYDVQNLEFDPIKINQELNAYFELLVRDRVNQAARAITLAFAVGSDLDAIASRYPFGLPRRTVTLGTWNGPGDQEPDSTYQMRVWLSPNILSLNGPGQGTYESYVFWALSAPMFAGEAPLRHASAFTRPASGYVYIPIMSDSPFNTQWAVSPNKQVWTLTPGASAVPTPGQVEAVYEYITAPNTARKGLTDVISILQPKVINVPINVDIYLFPGIDPVTAMNTAADAVLKLVQALRWLGADLTLLALEGALAQAGVYNTIINSPSKDQIIDNSGCINVTSVTLRYRGTGE